MLLFSSSLFAQELIEKEILIYSVEKNSTKAKKEIMQKVIERVSREEVQALIGRERFEEKQVVFKNKILPQSGKYIPFLRPGKLEGRSGNYSMKVELKISQVELRELLLKEGVLYFSKGEQSLLPMISFLDRVNSISFKWWFRTDKNIPAFLANESRSFQNAFREAFWKNDFYVYDPVKANLQYSLPRGLKLDSFSRQDVRELGQKLSAMIVVLGRVNFGKSEKNPLASQVEIELEAYLTKNARRLGRVERVIESDVGDYEEELQKISTNGYSEAAEDLLAQIKLAWEKGLFDATRVRLALKGDYNYQDLQGIKQQILKKSVRIKNIRERLFAPGRIEFEVDVAGGVGALQTDLKSLQYQGRSAKVEADESKIELGF